MVSERLFQHKWAFDSLKQCLDHVVESYQALRLSVAGIAMVASVDTAIRTLGSFEDGEGLTAAIESAEQVADVARTQMEQGHPLLHAQAVISLWGMLEETLRNFVANWLANEPNAMLAPGIQRLRIGLGRYENLNYEERHLYILDLLEGETLARFKKGVSRFEVLLEPFGLSGTWDETHERNLFEMHHLRNALLHRNGIVDRSLVDACPWLDLKVDTPIAISHKDYVRYMNSVEEYIVEIMQRVSAYFWRAPRGRSE